MAAIMSTTGTAKPGAVAKVLERYAEGKGLGAGRSGAEEGWRGRNKSWADIYSLHKEESRLAVSSIPLLSDISASTRLNHLLTSRLQSSPSRLSAYQATFADLIQSLPSHSLLLQRLKSGYEEVLEDYQSRLEGGQRLLRDVEDMMELQQQEKETLLGTIRELRREVGELNGALLRKTAKVAEVGRRMVEMMIERQEAASSDPSDLETQKAKSSAQPIMSQPPSLRPTASFLSPKTRQIGSALDLFSPIGQNKEAFVSDQEASRAEIKESMPRPIG